MWKPGNEGDWDQRLEMADKNALLNYWIEHQDEHQARISQWAESGLSERGAPASVLVPGEKLHIEKPNNAKNSKDRYGHFIALLGKEVIRTTDHCTPYSSEWMRYTGRIWERVSKEELKRAANSALGLFPKLNQKGAPVEVTPKMEDELISLAFSQEACQTLHLIQKWEQREGMVVFPNGTLRMGTKDGLVEFHKGDFDPSDRVTREMNFEYDAAQSTPIFDRFMASSFPDAQDRENVMQFMGYALDSHAKEKKWLLLVGPSDSGKTTIQTLLMEIVGGSDYVVTPNLDAMHRDMHWASELYKARLISIDEKTDVAPRDQKQISALIKQLTGNGQMTCRQMNKAPFTISPSAKLVMSCNTLPEFKDDSEAFWKRVILVHTKEPKREDVVKDIDDRLIAELPGIAAKIVQAWARMRKAGGFMLTPERIDEIKNYREANTPLIDFFNDWMLAEEGSCCYVRAILETYNKVGNDPIKAEQKFVIALRDTMKLSISRHTKADMQRMNVHHLPAEKYMSNSGYILRGYRCSHPHADIACGVPTVAPDLRGTQNDPTPMERPRPDHPTPILRAE